jgi:hypothetical protein
MVYETKQSEMETKRGISDLVKAIENKNAADEQRLRQSITK